ncbi:hypothetical protein PR003_g24693 [Phytophthora rubi]|uniref:Uncharacterized protein n=1 Tax=Phytophthora rubi TaxID=129364 RepID=A0A6A4CKM4_9STRA|nr:hypothetical protein PR003_g24693 [Phytophthora rubi]
MKVESPATDETSESSPPVQDGVTLEEESSRLTCKEEGPLPAVQEEPMSYVGGPGTITRIDDFASFPDGHRPDRRSAARGASSTRRTHGHSGENVRGGPSPPLGTSDN